MASEPQVDQDLADDPPVTNAARGRSETVQRLQVGISGLAGMILLVSLANIILDQARETEQGVMGEDPTVVAQDAPPPADPLADAGVVPDMPASATPTPGASGSNAPAARP